GFPFLRHVGNNLYTHEQHDFCHYHLRLHKLDCTDFQMRSAKCDDAPHNQLQIQRKRMLS
ncbi:hypothetical protein ACVXVO_004778, partial [Vibrio vulnificus]